MSHTVAGLLAMASSFVAAILVAVWYVAPWLRDRPARTALTALAWVHVFRYVAPQVLTAQSHGLGISDALRDQIMYGDLACAALALAAVVALRMRPSVARWPLWLLVVATVVDLANAAIGGLREGALETASGWSWMILAFYVPALWVGTALVVWVLVTRGGELVRGGGSRLTAR